MSIIFAFLALQASQAPQPAQSNQSASADDFLTLSFKWEDCVLDHARKWADTDESIDLISNAAMSACEIERYQSRVAAAKEFNRAGRKPKEVLADIDAWMEGGDRGVKKAVVQMILDRRAALKQSAGK